MEHFFQNESGQGLVEYGLIVMLVALAAIIGLKAVGGSAAGLLSGVEEKLTIGNAN